MKAVIDLKDLEKFIEKYEKIYSQRRKFLDPSSLKYAINRLFIERGFWIDDMQMRKKWEL